MDVYVGEERVIVAGVAIFRVSVDVLSTRFVLWSFGISDLGSF